MKTRRHHNNSGKRTTTSGKTRKQVAHMARRLGIPLTTDGNQASTEVSAAAMGAQRQKSSSAASAPREEPT